MFSLIIWAFFSLLLWLGLATLPAIPFEDAARGLPLAGGFVIATVLIYVFDARIVRMGGFRQWRPPRGWMVLAAFIGGCGAAILGSEIGNIALSLRDTIPEPPEGIVEFSPPVQALLWGLVHPVCFVIVLNDIVHRTFRAVHKPKAAWLFTLCVGGLFGGLTSMFSWLAVLALPTWLYRHSQSVSLSVAAMLPYGLGIALVVLGVGPGVPGFDVVDPEKTLWQPVWFDLLGAGLLAAGVFPFLQSFVPPVEPAPE